MAKWSGKVFFPTASQANRALAQGRYPRLPFSSWKPDLFERPIPTAKARLDGILVMIDYGLRVMSDTRLGSLLDILQDEVERNDKRWVPLDVHHVQRAIDSIAQEQRRRRTLLNPADRLQQWVTSTRSPVTWTQQDKERLRREWDTLGAPEEPS